MFDREGTVGGCTGRTNLNDERNKGQRVRKAKFSHVTP
jgi:hypothetical protein